MEWKKVKTHFDPETCDFDSNVPREVLLVSNGKWVQYIQEHGWDDTEYYFHNGTGKLDGVTHFMTLPNPPEPEQL